jgi:hypothetical protein
MRVHAQVHQEAVRRITAARREAEELAGCHPEAATLLKEALAHLSSAERAFGDVAHAVMKDDGPGSTNSARALLQEGEAWLHAAVRHLKVCECVGWLVLLVMGLMACMHATSPISLAPSLPRACLLKVGTPALLHASLNAPRPNLAGLPHACCLLAASRLLYVSSSSAHSPGNQRAPCTRLLLTKHALCPAPSGLHHRTCCHVRWVKG